MEEKENKKLVIDLETLSNTIGCYDAHILDLLHWISILEKLIEDMRKSDQNKDEEEEVQKIINRFTQEIGVRMINLLPKAYLDY